MMELNNVGVILLAGRGSRCLLFTTCCQGQPVLTVLASAGHSRRYETYADIVFIKCTFRMFPISSSSSTHPDDEAQRPAEWN